jgi:hypothetical protein
MVQKRIYIFIVMVIMMPACKIDRKNTVDRDKFTFMVSDDSFLFFQNVRQIYYDFQDLPQAKWYAYRFSDRSPRQDSPALTPVIVVNWLNDEGYLLVEANEYLQEERTIVIQEKNNSGRMVEYALTDRGRENMLEFATKIYEGIMDDREIYVRANGKFYPLFEDDEDRDNFRVVLADYYRLTRIF